MGEHLIKVKEDGEIFLPCLNCSDQVVFESTDDGLFKIRKL